MLLSQHWFVMNGKLLLPLVAVLLCCSFFTACQSPVMSPAKSAPPAAACADGWPAIGQVTQVLPIGIALNEREQQAFAASASAPVIGQRVTLRAEGSPGAYFVTQPVYPLYGALRLGDKVKFSLLNERRVFLPL